MLTIFVSKRRGQVNTYIEKISAVRSTRAVRDDLFLPLFWYEESGEIDDALEKEIKMKSIYPLRIAHYSTLFSLAVGSLFTVLSCVWCMCCGKRKKKMSTKTYSENEARNNYEKLTNLDDAESTKTDASDSNHGSKTVSIISNGSHDSIESNASFILVQPVHAEPLSPLSPDGNHATHSLAQLQLIPAFSHFNAFYPKRAAGNESQTEQTNGTKFKSQIEKNNLIPAVTYRPPSPGTLDESMKAISKLIELNSRNLVESDFALNHQQNHQQKNRSMNEFTLNQRRIKLAAQHSHDSFD